MAYLRIVKNFGIFKKTVHSETADLVDVPSNHYLIEGATVEKNGRFSLAINIGGYFCNIYDPVEIFYYQHQLITFSLDYEALEKGLSESQMCGLCNAIVMLVNASLSRNSEQSPLTIVINDIKKVDECRFRAQIEIVGRLNGVVKKLPSFVEILGGYGKWLEMELTGKV